MDPSDPNAELFAHSLSVRLRASEHAAVQPFIETFTDRYGRPSVALALRWLLSNPDVVAVMDARIASVTVKAS